MSKKSKRIQNVYRLSPMQEGMLFHSLLEKQSPAYVQQDVFSIKGEIDTLMFEKSFNMLIQRYDIFRTVFIHENQEEPLQVVLKERNYKVPVEDIAHLTETQQREYLDAFKEKDRQRGFELAKDLLMRVCLFKTGIDSYKLVWTFHHIIMDGWCLGIVIREWARVYSGLKRGETPRLEPVEQYENYIHWLDRQEKAVSINYWKNYLEGYERQAVLPQWGESLKVEGRHRYRLEKHVIELEQTMSTGIRELARKHRVTVNVVVQLIWGLLLQRYNNTDDVVFGAVVSGRPTGIAGIENMVGLFINTIPVRIRTGTGAGTKSSFPHLLKNLHREVLLAKAHEYVPLAEIQANTLLKNRLIDHIMVFENYPLRDIIENIGSEQELGFSIQGMETFEQTNYDFNIIVAPGKTIHIEFSFNSLKYRLDLINRAALHFKEIIKQVTENLDIDIDIRTISILTAEEKQRILYDFNDAAAGYTGQKTIPGLFAQQAENTPDNIALVAPAAIKHRSHMTYRTYLSYRHLDEKSRQLAHQLRQKGVEADTIVGLMVDRSLEMIIGILAILKSGGAYLPIDPGYPRERIDYMLKDSNAQTLVVDDTSYASCLSFAPKALLNLSEGHHLNIPASRLPGFSASLPSSLAYVIYTSGTTGKPKGTLTTHVNVIRVVKDCNYIHLQEKDRILQLSNYAFDGSVFDIYGALLNGAALVMIEKEKVLAVHQLAEVIKKQQVTVFFVTTALFNALVDLEIGSLIDIRKLLFGGEKVSAAHTGKARQYLGKDRIIHVYGPTETTVYATYYLIDQIDETPGTIPIGKPVSNTTVYILDKNLDPVPIGIEGEIYIGGGGVARGYLNNPALTNQKFLQGGPGGAVFSKSAPPGRRRQNLYKTGDLACWQPDGNIQFLGRIDRQVKIRGYRIEPGEIAAQLLKHEEIKDAVVTAGNEKNGEKYLCAYVVARRRPQDTKPADFDTNEIRAYLSARLPAYMVPAYFVSLTHIPLTPNGKLDIKALPAPGQSIQKENKSPAPRDEIEIKLVKVWAEVLDGPDHGIIGIDDNFFHLGGHSLKATRLVSRLRKEFSVEIPLAAVFAGPTVRSLAAYIKGARPHVYGGIVPGEKKEYYPQSSAQKRLFFLDRFQDTGTSYNMPSVLRLQGEIDKNRFEIALQTLLERQDSLRTSFHMLDNEPVQRIKDKVEIKVEACDNEGTRGLAPLSEDPHLSSVIRHLSSEFVRPFDLARAPLLRVGLIKENHNRCILLMDMHHIISDGKSMQILVDEFAGIYADEKPNPLKIQYKDFSCWQNNRFAAGKIKKQENYWTGIYADAEYIPVLNLPLDKPRPAVFSFEGDRYEFYLPAARTRQLKQICAHGETTVFMHLLAAFNVLLHKYTTQEDIITGSGIWGRHYEDIHHIIGLFVNTLALRNRPAPGKTFSEFLNEVKNTCIHAFENQDLQLEELVRQLKLKRDPSRNPLFDVCLVNQNLEPSKKQIKEISVEPHQELENKTAKFDITLFIHESDHEIRFEMEYYTAIFKPETIQRLANHFLNLLERVLGEPGALISEIDMMTIAERNRLLYDFNETAKEYPADKTIQQLFTEQAAKTPGYIAVIGPPQMKNMAYTDYMPHISYREFNEQSDKLAHFLKQQGAGPDAIVAIMMERSIEMITGIIGILKSGSAYMPIEPDDPPERIQFMLKDSGAKVLVTGTGLSEKLEKLSIKEFAKILNHTKIKSFAGSRGGFSKEPLAAGGNFANPPINNLQSKGSSLAYVIYTSGTTGKPKGILTSHNNVIRVVKNTNYIEINKSDRILQLSNYAFDGSVFDIYGTLLNDAALILIEKENVIAVDQLAHLLKKEAITVFFVTTALFNAIVEMELECLAKIRKVLFGGEQVSPDHCRRALEFLGKNRIIHVYGPTETTVFATYYMIDHIDEHITTIPIGSPIANTTAYILDKQQEPVPIGINGEIYIGGPGTARGYLNKPELTREKFCLRRPGAPRRGGPICCANRLCWFSFVSGCRRDMLRNSLLSFPASQLPNFSASLFSPPCKNFLLYRSDRSNMSYFSYKSYRLYKTGDLGRWLPDGSIEFNGRIDHQVKLRGFRVEPGEIENQLRKHENIKEAVVVIEEKQIPAKNNEKYLCAYVVRTNATPEIPGKKELKDFLAGILPGYMIPSYFIFLEKIPLTPNGKVDREALPGPDADQYEPGKEYTAPRDELEKKLADIWSEVLFASTTPHITQPQISLDDDFFEIGGHSLKATVLQARIQKELKIKIPLPEIFVRPTIRNMAGYIRGKASDGYAPIRPIEEKEYYPLSSAQKRLYILQQSDRESTAYNMAQNVVIKGDVEKKRLEGTFKKLIQRHESLRTSFHLIDHEPVQKVHTHVTFAITNHQVESKGKKEEVEIKVSPGQINDPRGGNSSMSRELTTSFISSFVRPFDLSYAPLLRVDLIMTGKHEGILMMDMHHIISDGASMTIFIKEFMAIYEEKELPVLRIRYKDFAWWQGDMFAGAEIKKQEEYWLSRYKGEIPGLNLPLETTRTAVRHTRGGIVAFEIGKQLTLKIKQLMKETGTTLYMVLLAIYNILLSRYSGQEDIIVGFGIAGRRHADIQNIIGMFVNMLAMRTQPQEGKNFSEYLEEVKENALNAYENQDYQFDRLVEKLGTVRESGRNPVFDTQFTFQDLLGQGRGDLTREMTSLTIEPYETGNENKEMQFDLSLNGMESGESIVMMLEYVTGLFKESTIREMAGHYLEILEQVLENTKIKLKDIKVTHNLLAGKSLLKEEDSLDYDF